MLYAKKGIVQFIKFALVGVSNTLIGLGTYYLCLWLGMHYLLANLVGFVVSVCNAWFWSRRYVFSSSSQSKVTEGIKLYISYGFTTLLSTGLMWVLVEYWQMSKYIAPVVCLCVTVPSNFLLNKFWVFRS